MNKTVWYASWCKKKKKQGRGMKCRFEPAFICMKEHWKVILGNNESGWGQTQDGQGQE